MTNPAPVNFSRIKESDWATLLRLAGEVAEMPKDKVLRRTHVMDTLCRMVGSTGGIVFDVSPDRTRRIAAPDSLVSVNVPDEQHDAIDQYLGSTVSVSDGFNAHLMPALFAHTSVLRPMFIDEKTWHRCDNYTLLMRPWKLDDRVHGVVRLGDNAYASMAMIRADHETPFGERERQLLLLFSTHAGTLLRTPQTPQAAAMESLPPRLRPVLKYFLEGDAEKQVAAKLGLSPHTVHEYAKALYRRFNVSSRGELLAKFQAR